MHPHVDLKAFKRRNGGKGERRMASWVEGTLILSESVCVCVGSEIPHKEAGLLNEASAVCCSSAHGACGRINRLDGAGGYTHIYREGEKLRK